MRTSSWVSEAGLRFTAITLTEPSGSTVTSSFGSPSLATSRVRPSGVKVNMSGRAPTRSAFTDRPEVSKRTTQPSSVRSAASTATATTFPWTATELAAPPRSTTEPSAARTPAVSRSKSFSGFSGSDTSRTSTTAAAALTTNRRWVRGSWATISAPEESKTSVL